MEVAAWLIPEHLLGGMDPQLAQLDPGRCDQPDRSRLAARPADGLEPVAALLPVIEPLDADWSLDDLADSPG